MTNYRADRVKTVTSGSSAVSSSAVWGVMKGTSCLLYTSDAADE